MDHYLMMRHQGLVKTDFYFPERMLNVRVYFLDLLVIFCTWEQVKGGSFLFILTQIWSDMVIVWTIVIIWEAGILREKVRTLQVK